MKFTIEISDEEVDAFIKEVMQNYPEADSGSALKCIDWRYKECEYTFFDDEAQKKHPVDLPKLRIGFEKMMKDIQNKKLPGIARDIMPDFMDGCNWDANAVDCLVQYAIFGELIYG